MTDSLFEAVALCSKELLEPLCLYSFQFIDC